MYEDSYHVWCCAQGWQNRGIVGVDSSGGESITVADDEDGCGSLCLLSMDIIRELSQCSNDPWTLRHQ